MRLHDYAPRLAHIKWLLDSDPAIRWQVMRDLTGEATNAIAAERSRVATEGWGAQFLARPAGALRSTLPSACSKDSSNTSGQGANRRPSLRLASGPKTICSSAACSARFELAKSSTSAGCASRSRRFGTTTCCADSIICEMQELSPTAPSVTPSKP